MARLTPLVAACAVVLVVVTSPAAVRVFSASAGPFAFLEPTIQISTDERQRLDERAVVLQILPARGQELAVLAAGALAVGPEALVGSVQNIVEFKRNQFVPQIGRFSAVPQPDDLRGLTLDQVDIDEIKKCRPDRCGLKLDAGEIARLKQAIAAAPNSSEAVDAEFRRVVLDRATQYLRDGSRAASPQFHALLERSPYLQSRMPELSSYLRAYPNAPLAGADSFLYWSKETYAWKPMISVTHVTITRGDGLNGSPEVVVAARDAFATRYTSGSLTLTVLLRDPDNPAQRYLVYINRTSVDAIRALWRPFVELRIRSHAKKVFADARARIERHGHALTAAR